MSLNVKETYGSVFEVKVHEKFTSANLTTGRKTKEINEETGKNVYSNSYWNASFVGTAFEKSKQLKDHDRIKIISGMMSHEASNKLDENGKKKYYYNLTVFDFEPVEGFTKKNSASDNSMGHTMSAPKQEVIDTGDDTADLPF